MSRSNCNGVIPREEIVDLALLMALNDCGERGLPPWGGIDAVHLTGLDQRSDDGLVFGPCVHGTGTILNFGKRSLGSTVALA